MKNFLATLRTGLAVGVLGLLPITVPAQNFWTPPTAAPRVCDIPVQGGSVRIIAGPGPAGNAFPATTSCPGGGGTCLEWQYEWQYTGVNPSLSLVSVDSNVKVVAAPAGTAIVPVSAAMPTSFDSSLNFGNVGSELGIRYTANSSTYRASFFTDTSAAVGTVTAGFKSGNKNGFCAIAGANKALGNNPGLSSPAALVTTTLGCTATWMQSADGCVTGVTATGPGCSVTPRADQAYDKQNLLNLHAASTTASCGTEINAPGSSNVCRYNSLLRTYTCVTVN